MFLGGDDPSMALMIDGRTMGDYKAEMQVVYEYLEKVHEVTLEFWHKVHGLPNPTPQAKQMAEGEHVLFYVQKKLCKLLLDALEAATEEAS